MRAKTVSISYERSFNLGNFESVKIGVHIWSEVDIDEDENMVCEYLFQSAKEQIKAQIPPSYKKANPHVQTTFSKFGNQVEKSEMFAYDEEELEINPPHENLVDSL